MKDFSRRDFLLGSSLFGLGLSAGLRDSLASPTEPHLEFPTDPRARLAVTSYPFRESIDSPTNPHRNPQQPGMDVKDFAAMAVKRFGIHNVCLLAVHFHSTDPAYLDTVRQSVEQAGSHIVDLGLGGGNFWDPDAAKRQAAVEYGQHWVDLALKLGSPSVRQHLRGPRGVKPDVGLASQSLGRLAEYGSTKNIIINLENDDLHNEDPFFIVEVIEKVGIPTCEPCPTLVTPWAAVTPVTMSGAWLLCSSTRTACVTSKTRWWLTAAKLTTKTCPKCSASLKRADSKGTI